MQPLSKEDLTDAQSRSRLTAKAEHNPIGTVLRGGKKEKSRAQCPYLQYPGACTYARGGGGEGP